MEKYKTTRADRRKNVQTYPHWVYGLYQDKELVYVGVTADPEQRAVSHSLKKRFQEFRLIKGFSNREKAEQFENFAIQEFSPRLNIVKLKPRKAGFKKSLPSFNPWDQKAWTYSFAKTEVFDFSTLNNKSIVRRRRWQENSLDRL
jgi:hypothetical protein